MAPCVRFSLLGKAVRCLIGFCPVCVSWQKRSVTVPFGHRLSDELSEIILDYLHFDHRLTTTVQWHYKMLEKPVVTTNNGLFPVLAVNVHNQQNSRSNASLYCPVVVLRPGRPEVRILPVAPRAAPYGVLLFLFCMDFMERIRTARAPRFASCGAETPRWGVSRAWLGESLRAHLKIALQCTLRSKAVIVGLIFNTRQETISVSHIVMFAEKTYNAFEPVGHTKRGKERES